MSPQVSQNISKSLPSGPLDLHYLPPTFFSSFRQLPHSPHRHDSLLAVPRTCRGHSPSARLPCFPLPGMPFPSPSQWGLLEPSHSMMPLLSPWRPSLLACSIFSLYSTFKNITKCIYYCWFSFPVSGLMRETCPDLCSAQCLEHNNCSINICWMIKPSESNQRSTFYCLGSKKGSNYCFL